MNPEKPSREQIEARLTALLLGELPAEEAALLRWTISQDAELAKLHDQLQVTIGFVREATAHPTETSAEKAVRCTLTEERRQKLLAHFKTPRPRSKDPIFWLRRIEVPRLVLALTAVAIIAVLAAMMLPALSKAKSKATRVVALNAARMLETEGLLAGEESKDSSAATLPAMPPPAFSGVVTVAPEPTLAPPPATIILPRPEESRDTSIQAGTSAIMPTDEDGDGNMPSTVHFSESVPPVAWEKSQPTVGFAITPSVDAAATPDRPPAAATAPAPQLAKAKQDAAKLVQDGRVLYETGRIKESEAKLNQALNLDSDNQSAYYYLNLNQQADLARANNSHTVDTQARVALTEKQWSLPSVDNPRSPMQTLPDQNQNNRQAQKDALDSFGYGTDRKSSTDQHGDMVAGVIREYGNTGGGGFGGGRGGMGGMGGGGNPFAAQFGNGANDPSAVASRQKTSRETASPQPNSTVIELVGGTTFTTSLETAGNRSRTVTEDDFATLGANVEGSINPYANNVLGFTTMPGANAEGSINGSSAVSERWGDLQGKAQNEITSSGRQTQMRATKTMTVDADRYFVGETVAPQNQGQVYQNQVAKTEANKASDTASQWFLGGERVRVDDVVASDRSNLGADKVPTLGDLPALGQKFTSRSAYLTPSSPVVAPPPSTQVTSGLYEFHNDNFVVAVKELPQSGGGSLPVTGPNTFARGTVVVGGKLAVNGTGSVGAETETRVFPLNHADPSAVANEVAINSKDGAKALGVMAKPDARTQSVVVTAPKGSMDQISEKMKALDAPPSRDQDVAVFKLQNADPQQAMEVLQDMFQAPRTRSGASTMQNSALQTRKSNTTTTSGNTSTSSRSSGPGGAVAGKGNLAFDYSGTVVGSTSISVDPETHNLVVFADSETPMQISNVIAKLDGQPQQRLIENGIIDVSATNRLYADSFKVDPDKFYSGLTGDHVAELRDKISPATGMSADSSTNDFRMDFRNVPAGLVLDYLREKAGLTIVQEAKVKGNVSMAGDHLTQEQALDTLNTALSRNGYAAIRNGSELVIVAKNEVKIRDIPVSTGNASEAPKTTEVVTQLIPLRFIEAQKLVDKLASSVSAKTVIAVNDGGKAIVVTDTPENVKRLARAIDSFDIPPRPSPTTNAPVPQPEVLARDNNFSTFSLNVSDVSFKLAAASLEKGQLPDTASIRSEEFINAFDYRDPEAAPGQPLAFASERTRYPFAVNRDLLRFSVKTAAAGRPAGRALNLVLLLDNSGSMERADRVAIIREALRVLAAQLQPQDQVSVVTFARTARLWADGVSGSQVGEVLERVGGITPEGGTNLEEAMRLAYETARRHYLANGMNRVVLLTDGAANLGDVNPAALKLRVEAQRKQGIALDCFGVGFEDFNDDLLQQLSSNGDGRYAFLNSPEEAHTEFAAKLAGALQVAAQDVKVQVEFNPQRVVSWRQIGYAKHQLTKEQFRDNTVDAAEIAAQEAGNALYTVETKPDGSGPVATVRVRYKVPGTREYRERSWDVAYEGGAPALDQASPAMRLAGTASAFSEWLAGSAFAQQVTLDELQKILGGVPQVYGADQRPAKLATMIREAKSAAGQPVPASQPLQWRQSRRPGGF